MEGAQDERTSARYLRKLSHTVPGSGTGAVEATIEALKPVRAEEALEQAVRTIERELGKPIDAAIRAEVERLFLEDGKRAIDRLKEQGVGARLPPGEQDALEAIVEFDGSRPTLPIDEANTVDLQHEALGLWREAVTRFAGQISTIASAVGRIDLNGVHKGTGFVVGEDLVLTNRHVLQQIAIEREDGRWEFRGTPTISFDSRPDTRRVCQFAIERVVQAGPEAIDLSILDLNRLDYSILKIQISDGAQFPRALSLESDVDKIVEERPVFTIGYPGEPAPTVYENDVLARLFAHRYGVKRFAPGQIDRELGSSSTGTGETVFCHDATTLGGSSGSCVVDLGNDGRLVVGLHFAGVPKRANYAHANARLREGMAELKLTWRDWVHPRMS